MQGDDIVIPMDEFSDTNYILHLTSTTASDLTVPLTADVTTANVPDIPININI